MYTRGFYSFFSKNLPNIFIDAFFSLYLDPRLVYSLSKFIVMVLRTESPLCTLHVTRTFPAPSITSAKIPPRPQLPPDIPTDAHLPFLLGFSANSKISLARTYPPHLHRLRCLEFTLSSDKHFILLVTYLPFHTIIECESSHKSLFSRLQRVALLYLTPAPGGYFRLLKFVKEILPL